MSDTKIPVKFSRGKSKQLLDKLLTAEDGTIYFSTEGGVYLGNKEGKAVKQAPSYEEFQTLNTTTETLKGEVNTLKSNESDIKENILGLHDRDNSLEAQISEVNDAIVASLDDLDKRKIENSGTNTTKRNTSISFTSDDSYVTYNEVKTIINGRGISITNSGTPSLKLDYKGLNISSDKNNTTSYKSGTINYKPTIKESYDLNLPKESGTLLTNNSLYKEVTWEELRNLRDNSNLIPGALYRITDYITTTITEDTQSAGHPFDVIVTALDTNKLSETASAIQSARDINGYFSNSKLTAWQLWYCLDNDTRRFRWVNSTNGKGVIYRMIDEFNNDIPYDFKNIQFKHPNRPTIYPHYYYTFANSNIENNSDASLNPEDIKVYNNTIGIFIDLDLDIDSSNQRLNKNIFIGDSCYDNTFGESCFDNTFGDSCNSNIFGNTCYSNTFGNYFQYNTFENGCNTNTFGNNCHNNAFGYMFQYNQFGNYYFGNIFGNTGNGNEFGDNCVDNTFGNNCCNITFGDYCNRNTFEDSCCSITFGNYCESNTFGKVCEENTFINNCNYNTFGNNCNYNTFGNNCSYNYFKDDCTYNSFKDNCNHNTFGNYCDDNYFGDGCSYNSFENHCGENFFGNYHQYNSFGNECYSIICASDSISSTKHHWYRHNHFGDGCQYIVFTGAGTASSSSQVQNYNFSQGTSGTDEAYLIVEGKRGLNYETKVAKNSNGEVKQYCEADLIK